MQNNVHIYVHVCVSVYVPQVMLGMTLKTFKTELGWTEDVIQRSMVPFYDKIETR